MNGSPKIKSAFGSNVSSTGDVNQSVNVRPLCPTRWLVRAAAIRAFIDNFGAMLDNLEKVSTSDHFSAEQRATASGLLARISKPEFLLGLPVALEICQRLEILNASCQGTAKTLSGTKAAVDIIINDLLHLREDEVFKTMFDNVNAMLSEHGLEEITAPRQRRSPARYTGPAFVAQSVEQYYKLLFYNVVDTCYADERALFTKKHRALCKSRRCLVKRQGKPIIGYVPRVGWTSQRVCI